MIETTLLLFFMKGSYDYWEGRKQVRCSSLQVRVLYVPSLLVQLIRVRVPGKPLRVLVLHYSTSMYYCTSIPNECNSTRYCRTYRNKCFLFLLRNCCCQDCVAKKAPIGRVLILYSSSTPTYYLVHCLLQSKCLLTVLLSLIAAYWK